MIAPFDEDEAYQICQKVISLLDRKVLVLKHTGKISEERQDIGIMIGAMVAVDSKGTKFNFVAVSGTARELAVNLPVSPELRNLQNLIIVPPVVQNYAIQKALEKNDDAVHKMTAQIEALEKQISGADNQLQIQLKNQIKEIESNRTALTTESFYKVLELYNFNCFDGSVKNILEISKGQLTPGGTGECCAPKLLDYCFKSKYRPVSMCEVYYGNPSEHKIPGQKYPPCDERCGIILPSMLGLEILYRDKDIIVVNKQSGVLSVPGREEKDCIVNRVRNLFPDCIEQPSVHRLDMETSGLLVLAFNKEAHRNLSMQFEAGTVSKKYEALIDGILPKMGIPTDGQSTLYFRLDPDNRPHQIWDEVYGKKAITSWHIEKVEDYTAPDKTKRPVTRITFEPVTGRTHQLRLASSDSHGFGCPIIGDTLYGTCAEGERLMLHAKYLSFKHPVSGQQMEFNCPAPF